MFPRLTGSENNILIIIFIVFHLHIISLAHVYFCNQTMRVKISYSSQHSHIMLFQNSPFGMEKVTSSSPIQYAFGSREG